ncbi:hypothetical protein MNBD_ALPHA04-2227 [hydrothermal vent metagenome]|uniref:Arylesterase n=1 Tax=hydrothermal vent metagenome TaxID=652676 RepID=A0A3B0RVP3_9ZZZZ
MIKRISIAVILLIFIIAIWFLSVLLPIAGVFDTLEPRLAKSCTPLDISPGTEDVAIDRKTNLVFVSATNRRPAGDKAGVDESEEPVDGIFVFNLNKPTLVRRVSPPGMTDFHPHGISLWHGKKGEARLFAINHSATGEDYVEVFEVGAKGLLTHLESISFAAMHAPNDILGVGPRQFYIVNDRGYETGLLSSIEQYFALPFASAAYFDGNKGRYIQKSLSFASGINQSPDGKTIYISELMKRQVSVFDRNIETGTLEKLRSLKINMAPDNIDVDQKGILWVAGHPRLFEFLEHAGDRNAIAPSIVVKIDPKEGAVEDVFVAIDGEINASSVGAVHNKTLIVGAIFNGHVMICPLP